MKKERKDKKERCYICNGEIDITKPHLWNNGRITHSDNDICRSRFKELQNKHKQELEKLGKKVFNIMKQEEDMSYYWHDVEKEINKLKEVLI